MTANSQEQRGVRRALIGVSDKSGLLELATGLHAAGVEVDGSTLPRARPMHLTLDG